MSTLPVFELPEPPAALALDEAAASEPWQLDVVAIVARFRARQLSPRELLEAYLARIERYEPLVQGWVSLDVERARAAAREAEQRWQKACAAEPPPLCGVPVGIKDVIWTRDLVTKAGSPLYQDFRPPSDAAAVAALREAGAIILGKTTTTEFAYGDPPPTRNPWNLGHTPGGSSSGSAACLAARMVPLALGTQTVGSIIRPAAYCGVCGLMPRQALISLNGVFPVSPTLDHVGPMGLSVRDLRYVLSVLASGGESTRYRPLPGVRGLRAGLPDRHFDRNLDPEVARALDEARRTLEELGVSFRSVSLPDSFEAAEATRATIIDAEAATYHDRHLREAPDRIGPELRRKLEQGRQALAIEYLKALEVQDRYRAEMRALFEQVDLLFLPATPTPAPAGLAWTGDRVFIGPLTHADLPTLTFPVGHSRSGLPIGLQLAAPDEATVLAVGEAYQAMTDWHRQAPALDRA
ncbi:MAG TPA: amidase [Bacillota bacterium]